MRAEITGEKFGRLTAIKPVGKDSRNNMLWLCKCDCGGECVRAVAELRKRDNHSCGCLGKEHLKAMSKNNITHGMSGSRLLGCYKGMMSRCYRKKDASYQYYGGRGIGVCDKWHDFDEFEKWALESGFTVGLTLDRIDTTKDYSPENCRWATKKEQANNKRNTHFLTYNGETHTISEWSEISGINRSTLNNRLWRGWSAEKIFTAPVTHGNQYTFYNAVKRGDKQCHAL